MKIKWLHRRMLVIFAIIVAVLAALSYCWTTNNVNQMQKRQRSKLSPIIMIPGSSATVNRFDSMVQKINSQDRKQHSLLKVKCYNDGKITYTGSIRRGDNEPFIVVGFENNHDGYSNIKKQAKMFNKAFDQLEDRYNFNNFKGIGHSNGG